METHNLHYRLLGGKTIKREEEQAYKAILNPRERFIDER